MSETAGASSVVGSVSSENACADQLVAQVGTLGPSVTDGLELGCVSGPLIVGHAPHP